MTKTMESLMEATARTMAEIRPGEVCAKCRDRTRCEDCAFQPSQPVTSPPNPA